ncbi:MAG: thiamine phosphate synthase [Parvularculaceae bacterium]|nr:thiamine phosphate synthase [Parvularculaceae bacterium]
MEGLRTRAATLAAAARALNAASAVDAPFSLAFLTDMRGPDPELVARSLPRGAAIILRHYEDRKRAALARRLRVLTAARGALLLIGADPELARVVGADGVHWRSGQLDAARPLPGLIVSAACHSAVELRAAYAAGADCAFASPVFPTRSHPEAELLGRDRFLRLAAAAPLPVLALGGIDERTAARLAGSNVAGFGAVGAFAAR